jgi:chromosome partitioning protein
MLRLLVWTGKGGTGKTTTVNNLAAVLAGFGLRVLILGFDPSGDCESTWGIDEDDSGPTRVETLLANGGDPREAAIELPLPEDAKRGGRLRLLACSSQLDALTESIKTDFGVVRRLVDSFEGEIDIVLIDAQGTLTPLSHAAARAADSVLFTMEPGFYEFRAIDRRLAEMDLMAEQEGWRVDTLGVLFVRTAHRSRDMRELRAHLEDSDGFGLYVFNAHTRQQSSVRSDPRSGAPTVMVAPRSNVADDYRAVGRELLALLKTRGEGGRA